jgi:hypothetical protein
VQVWQLASARNCSSSYTCAFYRNEPRPGGGWLSNPLPLSCCNLLIQWHKPVFWQAGNVVQPRKFLLCSLTKLAGCAAAGDGPPYALLQGRMHDLAQVRLG